MSWQERDYADDDPMRRLGRPGGDWQGLRPTLDNPMTWSVFLLSVSRIAVRVHIVYLIFIVVQLLRSFEGGTLGFGLTALWLGGAFILVLAHEFGHCLACRWTGGTANEILMWPLGGLAYCLPPHHWKAHLITVVGGPMVNFILLLILGPLLAVLTGTWWGVAIPHPLYLETGFAEVAHSWPLIILYLLNHSNFILLLFNVLLPMFPLDGGRILQAILWWKLGWSRSMRISLRMGYLGAILLGIFGLVVTNAWLVGIAIFGGLTCYVTHKQVEYSDAVVEDSDQVYGLASADEDANDEPSPRASRRAARRAERDRNEAAEVDRILGKIAASGMDSLTRSERNLLRRATERKKESQP